MEQTAALFPKDRFHDCRHGRFGKLRGLVVAGAALVLSACATSQDSDPLRFLLADLQGQGELTALDDRAARRAALSERAALESAPTGGTRDWESGRFSGRVSPGAPYEVANRVCRRFTHTISIEAQSVVRSATACRGDDDIWRIVGA